MLKFIYTLFFSLLLLSCQSPEQIHNIQGNALGTTYSITYVSQNPIPNLKISLDSLYTQVNKSMSTYLKESDISKINQGVQGVQVDAMFKEVFQISKTVHQNTKGYFDPTVGNLVNAWGFGPNKSQLNLTNQQVDSLMQFVGFSKLELSSNQLKQPQGFYLDFNAVAKGYCIDRIGVLLSQKGIKSYLIELGGELLAKGTKPNESLWTIGIDDPNQQEERTLFTTVNLKDKAMATSGNYRKFREDSLGNKYVHIVDPTSGFAKPSSVLSVSVKAPTCALADAYATAFMTMPIEQSKYVLQNQNDLEAYFIISEGTQITTFETPNFKSNH